VNTDEKIDIVENKLETVETHIETVEEKTGETIEGLKTWLGELLNPMQETLTRLESAHLKLSDRLTIAETSLERLPEALTPPVSELESIAMNTKETPMETSLSEAMENPVESVEEKVEEIPTDAEALVEEPVKRGREFLKL